MHTRGFAPMALANTILPSIEAEIAPHNCIGHVGSYGANLRSRLHRHCTARIQHRATPADRRCGQAR